MNYPSSPFFQRTLRGVCVLVLVLASSLVHAQKFAYIDSDYVLLHMPEYATAQTELNNFAIQWQSDIESKLEAADRLEVAYRAERVLLTAEMRVKREEEISKKRAEAKDMQKQKFGVDGELFQKRQELIEPVQQQIFSPSRTLLPAAGTWSFLTRATKATCSTPTPNTTSPIA